MNGLLELRLAERRAFSITFEHGLWDLFVSCFVAMFALAPLLSDAGLGDFWSSAVFIPFWALAYGVLSLVRRRVVGPRLGTVQFGRARRSRLQTWLILAMLLSIVAVITGAYLTAHFDVIPVWVGSLWLGAVMLCGFSLAGYFLNLVRLCVFGALLFVAAVSGEWLYANWGVAHHGYPVTFGLAAGVIALSGVIRFVRFVIQHPLPAPAAPAAGA